MDISNLRVGIIHSLIGKNDGVSIVIDQTVHAMVDNMGINLGNIFFLAAHSSPRFNARTNEVFWHKSELHTEIISTFGQEPAADLEQRIEEEAHFAKGIINEWVEKNHIDLIIAHNTSHTYNFITAVALGYYFEDLREQGIIWPKILVWWHDSYFEREIFAHPNSVMQKYLKYLPGTYVDAIAFINHQQIELGKKVFAKYNHEIMPSFFKNRAVVVPNTSAIEWDYKVEYNQNTPISPIIERYNKTFWRDCGLVKMVEDKGFSFCDTKILMQHTRIVPRKKIETAIELAFELDKKFKAEGHKKCIALVVTGHSGDEQNYYKKWLNEFYEGLVAKNPDSDVVFLMSEGIVMSHRDIIIDKKYYKFAELPALAAAAGGIGTYFSEVEGFGNNLLELISFGVPVVINKYEIYKTEIEQFGFKLPATENAKITPELVDETYRLLTDIPYRNKVVLHNLQVLEKNLGHHIIAEKIAPLIVDIFTKMLPNYGKTEKKQKPQV